MTRILIVSNGFGEDWIGAKIATALQRISQEITIQPAPTMGEGHHYRTAGFDPALRTEVPPSGGFLRRWKDIFADLADGLISRTFHQRRQIRKMATQADAVIAVGDVFCLWMASVTSKPVYFLPTAKSDRFMPHSALEYGLIKSWARKVFPRDEETTESFSARQIPAAYFGNPMMDGLTEFAPLPSPSGRLILTLLPGSRAEAYDNLELALSQLIPWEGPPAHLWIARPASLDKIKIQQILTTIHPNENLTASVTDQFAPAVLSADVIIGMAGTANEQAAYLGKPVIAVVGSGPQSSKKRFEEQARLMGSLIHIYDPKKDRALAEWVIALKSTATSPPPAQNAAHRIAETIVKDLRSDKAKICL
ncbi:hypothetical protein EBR96_02180 [bacterium]|nr:hypothetical protein [bacterium]